MLDQYDERGLCKHKKIRTQNDNISTKRKRSVLSIKDKHNNYFMFR